MLFVLRTVIDPDCERVGKHEVSEREIEFVLAPVGFFFGDGLVDTHRRSRRGWTKAPRASRCPAPLLERTDVIRPGHIGKAIRLPGGSAIGDRLGSGSGPPTAGADVPGFNLRALKRPGGSGWSGV